MPASFTPSESLVGSLCQETARLRDRWRQLQADLMRCQEASLRQRLAAEQTLLLARRQELQRAARHIRGVRGLGDNLAQAFLDELTHRPMPG